MTYEEAKKFTRTFLLGRSDDQDDALDVKGLLRARKLVIRIIATAAFVVLLFHRSSWPADSLIPQALIRFGVLFLAVAVAGRTWAWVHLGRRRHLHFVADGPYSVVRHPLYTFSMVGAAGIGMQSGSLVVTVLALLIVWAVLGRMARLEEAAMVERFGEPYLDYLARTPRFIPNVSLWATPEGVWVEYRQAIKGFRDASLFLLALPVFMAIDYAQQAGLLPVLFKLP